MKSRDILWNEHTGLVEIIHEETSAEKLKEREYFEDLGIARKEILKWILR
jgi:hypothetical protein